MTKKVVYLFGAGATQAAIKSIDPARSLMTADIQRLIEQKYSGKRNGFDSRIWNELITPENDIEHLISVLESQHNYSYSYKLRKLYRDALVKLAKAYSKSLQVNLYTVLFDLHRYVKFDEQLLCFMTLNYEDLLEQSLRKHFGYAVDYVIKSTNKKTGSKETACILKLHGSFNWINTRPVQTRSMTAILPGDTLWIPPGVDKHRENYPFNTLWGKASEYLMECDVVRIVGCSLSRNDWGLIPILYTAQRFADRSSQLEIEIIDFLQTGKAIKDNYSYLNVKDITEIKEVTYFYKQQFSGSSDEELKKEMESEFSGKDKMNPFRAWLDAKIGYLVNEDHINIETPHKYVYKFYNKV
jgi:hypothetical protein